MLRVGLLTSGGDCQALNATMRGVAKGLYELFDEVEIYGFLNGYKGLMRAQYIKMMPDDFSGIMTKGGTILGSSRQPFKLMGEPTEDGLDKVKSMKDTYKKLKLDCLCVLGGNGSQKTANLLSEEGLNVIGLPKTIDNDLWGTDMTFGFQSAVDVATQTIDCIHTTAASHNRIFIVEIMGHKVGWITLHAGIAGGADVILIPEIPYDIKKVYEAIDKRTKNNKGFTIVAVAEGAISKEVAELPKKKRKEAIDTRNEADSFVFQTQQALDQVGANLDANDKAEVEADLNAVKSFLDAHQNAEEMTDADVAELKAAQEKLTQSAQKVFAKMYEQTQAAQGAQGAGPDMGNMGGAQTNNAGAADDDVVDADFKEV